MEDIAVIINKQAKNACDHTKYTDCFSEKGISYQLYDVEPEELDNTIKKCVENHSIILIGGGDGSIRSAAQYCTNQLVIMGVLPLGTLNHFNKELGLPSTPDELVDALITRHILEIDIGEVNGLVFVNNSSIGFYPAFVKKRIAYTKFYNKWLSYIPSFIKTFNRHKTFLVTLINQETDITLNTSFIMISNNEYSHQYPMSIQREHFNQGVLGIYFLKRGKLRFSKLLHSIFSSNNHFEFSKTTNYLDVSFKDNKKVSVALDGEVKLLDTPLKYKLLPLALKLLTNKA